MTRKGGGGDDDLPLRYRELSVVDHESSEDQGPPIIRGFFLTLPLGMIVVMFMFEAYERPFHPFAGYNPMDNYYEEDDDSYYYEDDNMQQQQQQQQQQEYERDVTGNGTHYFTLTDMLCITMSLVTLFGTIGCYLLIYKGLYHAIIQRYLTYGQEVIGNLVYDGRSHGRDDHGCSKCVATGTVDKTWSCCLCQFQYYGNASYPHPDVNVGGFETLIRKRVPMTAPYTKERVTIVCLPDFVRSGQGKDELQYANQIATKSQSRDVFVGWICILWTTIYLLVSVYILRQMRILHEVVPAQKIAQDYDNPDTGWMIFWIFMSLTILGVSGSVFAWCYQRWWFLYQGYVSIGDLSTHGIHKF